MSSNIYFSPHPIAAKSNVSVRQVEEVMSNWFCSPVVLTSSGRAAIRLILDHLGLNRYANTVSLPRMISSCVMDAVVSRAFPKDAATNRHSDVTLIYHQYGFIQDVQPSGFVLEDACHAFFGYKGAVNQNSCAVFSIPKFFATSSMCGGVIASSELVAEKIRSARDREPIRSYPEAINHMDVFHKGYIEGSRQLPELYASRLANSHIGNNELGGIPLSLAEIEDAKRRRQEIGSMFSTVVSGFLPPGWKEKLDREVPYAFPVMGTDHQRVATLNRLHEIGVIAGEYMVDLKRNVTSPQYAKMLLIPCHQEISDTLANDISMILVKHGEK